MKKLSLLAQYSQNRDRYLDTDKEHPNHGYISKCYDELFSEYQNKPINFLEIGLASGGSLLLWNDYFTNAKIYGVDSGADSRFTQCIENVKQYPNINLIKADAYDPKLNDVLPNFDIIIDDGPHTLDSHIKCLNLYLPKLNSNGVLIIEDIGDEVWIEEYKKVLLPNCDYKIIDTDRNIEYNNLLFVIRKK